MPRPIWVAFWVPFWGPFWGPIRTGPLAGAQKPCKTRVSEVVLSPRQPSGLRKHAERGTGRANGRQGRRRLALLGDQWSHARPASRRGACKGCGDDPSVPLPADLDRRGPPANVAYDAAGAARALLPGDGGLACRPRLR